MTDKHNNSFPKITENIDIHNMIFSIRERQVMIDRDLAKLYQVETKVLNQAVKRNIERFPDKFRFQLNDAEKKELVTNCDRLNVLKHTSTNPFAFTEQGVSMLSAVLKSNIAVKISIQIMDAFVEIRKYYTINSDILRRLKYIEKRQIVVEKKFEEVLNAFEDKNDIPHQGIFFDGQVFDAFVFVTKLIQSADYTIKLIDNFIDEQVLTLVSKKQDQVRVSIYTSSISKHLELAVKRFNEQFPPLEIHVFKQSHDRFLIIDEKEIYHIGASLKDLGKKWFAFSRLNIDPQVILKRIK